MIISGHSRVIRDKIASCDKISNIWGGGGGGNINHDLCNAQIRANEGHIRSKHDHHMDRIRHTCTMVIITHLISVLLAH